LDRFTKIHEVFFENWELMFHILHRDPELKDIYSTHFQNWLRKVDRNADKRLEAIDSEKRDHLIESYQSMGIERIPIYDTRYPPLLKQIDQPPFLLYSMGNLNVLQSDRMLSVIGSREMSEYGKRALEEILPAIIERKIIIVSGGARGIDGYSHRITLRHQGSALVVLGGGLWKPYPKENVDLFRNIRENGALISEIPPLLSPQKQKPYRRANRRQYVYFPGRSFQKIA
jgi:DNA processing protein